MFIAILGTVILFKDLLIAGTYQVYWANFFDGALFYWIINWGYHILVEELNPANFWNANSFYPNSNTLAYADSLLSLQIIFSPLRFLGMPPMLAFYLSLAATCVAGCLLTKIALDRIGGFTLVESGLIIYSSHFSLSVINFLANYKQFGYQFAPPFFLFLYLYLRRNKTSDLIFLCITFSLGAGLATYLVPILFTFSIFLSLPFLIRAIFHSSFRNIFAKIDLKDILIVATFATLLYFLLLRPYILVDLSFPALEADEAPTYSANINSLFKGFTAYSYWYSPNQSSQWGEWEYAYFPGYLLLFGGVGFLIFLIYFSLKKIDKILIVSTSAENRSHFVNSPTLFSKDHQIGLAPDLLIYMTLLFIITIVLSWGPNIKLNNEVTNIKLPFYWLRQIIPGLNNVRVPGRMGMFIGLPLSIYLIFLIRKLFLAAKMRTLLAFFLLLAIIIESFPLFSIYPFSVDPQGVYVQVSQHDVKHQPLLELPVADIHGGNETILRINEQLVGSTIHWAKLVSGYGARFSEENEQLLAIDNKLQKHETSLKPIIDFAKNLNISFFLIHLDRYPPDIAEDWREFASKKKVCKLWENENTIFMKFGSQNCEHP